MKRFFFSLLFIGTFLSASAQPYIKPLNEWISSYEVLYPTVGKLRVVNVKVVSSGKYFQVYGNTNFQYLNFRPALVEKMIHEIDSIIAPTYKGYKVVLFANDVNVQDLIPNYYRTEPNKQRLSKSSNVVPFVVNNSQPYTLSRGLENRHIALWHSHGWYYDQKTDRWHWQRARLFETVEDKLTLSFVLPYLLPMLENAGAYVWLPRERDTQPHEVIVDNDESSEGSVYHERGSHASFEQGGSAGFGWKRKQYVDFQNPFTDGTYRLMRGEKQHDAQVEWIPDIPERGRYAVSIAYKSVPNATKAAHYTVHHLGGTTHFTVNQSMGGGTWVYLGTFEFDKGKDRTVGSVVLTNQGLHGNEVIVADAVRFGGGMGNVARRPATEADALVVEKKTKSRPKLLSGYEKEEYELSERPRYLEGARYWLQWAGAPDSVYSKSKGINDYTDDYAGRGYWVNWLARGSELMPDSVGLKVPLEMSFAFHTDAGSKENGIVGSLGIYTTDSGDKHLKETFPNKQSRYASRDLTDLVMSSIVDDIRALYDPNWSYRGMWNKSYAESRIPEVPAMLLELLSHQNYEDMLYGLDPRFRFTVSRAIYKGILRFVATQHELPYLVQPLPVSHFCAELQDEQVLLRWRAVQDTLEPSATPTGYVVYSRKDGGGFDNGVYVSDTTALLPLEENVMMSYRVVAVNDGGASMPSEILSVYQSSHSKGNVMVVNGFTRIGAPQGFWAGDWAGFPDWLDHGVADGYNLSYVGQQYEYDRKQAWTHDDAPGWGGSKSNYETIKVAGNSFDFPYIHGLAMVEAGYSFVSSSVAAVESGMVNLNRYKLVDLILGEQKQSVLGRDSLHWQYKTFSVHLQRSIRNYCQNGGALLVTGAFVGSDLCQNPLSNSADAKFANEVLHLTSRTTHASTDGEVMWVYSPLFRQKGKYHYAVEVNDSINAIESADGIEPYGNGAYSVMRYSENNISAAVGYRDKTYRTLVLGFPFESVLHQKDRNKLMRQMLEFLTVSYK